MAYFALCEDLPHEVEEVLVCRETEGEANELIDFYFGEDHLRSEGDHFIEDGHVFRGGFDLTKEGLASDVEIFLGLG